MELIKIAVTVYITKLYSTIYVDVIQHVKTKNLYKPFNKTSSCLAF